MSSNGNDKDSVLDVGFCSSCGQEHEDVVFELLSEPYVDEDGDEWTHEAKCPVTGQTLMMAVITMEESEEG